MEYQYFWLSIKTRKCKIKTSKRSIIDSYIVEYHDFCKCSKLENGVSRLLWVLKLKMKYQDLVMSIKTCYWGFKRRVVLINMLASKWAERMASGKGMEKNLQFGGVLCRGDCQGNLRIVWMRGEAALHGRHFWEVKGGGKITLWHHNKFPLARIKEDSIS